ncbi:hypothetical protein BDV27DRAFT_97329 [Aspergillus caelatus]|uniref:Uncharacterized protein n=1 Tax=Aspergillus caelatus TaxID=61420 RepID=A0A5N7AMU8_9EURO|nr:uncharacterized protein BDV27DRAFT_97329 [Aspergillus caelatus]KAE8370040.1 hypothetical protein BDV27DRAFT_97329 [Aspergillus caelatus]
MSKRICFFFLFLFDREDSAFQFSAMQNNTQITKDYLSQMHAIYSHLPSTLHRLQKSNRAHLSQQPFTLTSTEIILLLYRVPTTGYFVVFLVCFMEVIRVYLLCFHSYSMHTDLLILHTNIFPW